MFYFVISLKLILWLLNTGLKLIIAVEANNIFIKFFKQTYHYKPGIYMHLDPI